MEATQEERLAERLKAGEPDALQQEIEVYGAGIYQLVRRILDSFGAREDIEECVSDVFAAAWNKIAELLHRPFEKFIFSQGFGLYNGDVRRVKSKDNFITR